MNKKKEHTITEGVAVRSGLAAGYDCYEVNDFASAKKCIDEWKQREREGLNNLSNQEEYKRCMKAC